MYYVIRSLKMTHYLVRQGFDIQNINDSNENPKLKVFLFTDSPELRRAITRYTKESA